MLTIASMRRAFILGKSKSLCFFRRIAKLTDRKGRIREILVRKYRIRKISVHKSRIAKAIPLATLQVAGVAEVGLVTMQAYLHGPAELLQMSRRTCASWADCRPAELGQHF